MGFEMRTLFPTINDSPSGAHTKVKASPRPLTSLTQAFVLTSQNLTTPSSLTLHSSASLTGLKATFCIDAACPLSSVEKRAMGFSGFPGWLSAAARPWYRRIFLFEHESVQQGSSEYEYSQTRRVLSEAPVATRFPRGFHAMDRILRTTTH